MSCVEKDAVAPMKSIIITANNRVQEVRNGEVTKPSPLFCPFKQDRPYNCHTQCVFFDIDTEKYTKGFCPDGVAVCGLAHRPLGKLVVLRKENKDVRHERSGE